MATPKESQEPKEDASCIFCKIARKEIPANFVYESENFVAFPDIHPKKPGHTLIIPKSHYDNLMGLPTLLAGELLLAIKKVADIRIKGGAEGFNLVVNSGKAAGQVVPHLHFHIVPRKSNDGGLFSGKDF